MIKKLFIPFIVILISFLLVINYLSYKSPKENKLITQNKAYSLTNDNDLNVLIYANKKTSLQEEEAVEVAYLTDFDYKNKLKVSLEEIKTLNKYKYLNDNYTEYNYKFRLPLLNNYFYLEEAYLLIRLKNGHEHQLKIGSFDYYLKEEILNVVELSGVRYDDFPTLKSVTLKFSLTEDIFIEHIYLSKTCFKYVGKTLKDNEELTINFDKFLKITNSLTIKIDYQIESELYKTTLPFFTFYKTNENPLEYSVLNNVYLLD